MLCQRPLSEDKRLPFTSYIAVVRKAFSDTMSINDYMYGILDLLPITLSGGELLLLNFAKAHISESITDKIFICTPTQWLHPSKYWLLSELIKLYQNSDNKTSFMEGEKGIRIRKQIKSTIRFYFK